MSCRNKGWRSARSAGLCALASLPVVAALATPPMPQPPPDAPDARPGQPAAVTAPPSYAAALQQWRSAEDVDAWIGTHFEYDGVRALVLSETARAGRAQAVPVVEPEAFFASPRGVCVDLTRFAVESLRRIDPRQQVAYLMIEFEPQQLQGQVLRRHWLASLQRDGAWWFFADSKRPGHLAGPYDSVEQFIADYAQWRERRILNYRLAPSHERRMRLQRLAPG